ncbi:hypothetical protein D3C75_721950 [compost metagenome]
MVVHGIRTELGVVQLGQVPAQGNAELAAVAGFIVVQARDVHVVVGTRRADVAGDAGRQIEAGHHQAVVATPGHAVVAEEGATVVHHRVVPLQLIERLGGEVFGKPLGDIQHVHRDQAFLDLGPWPPQGGHVNRVDAVDRVADEGAFAPAHHLLAQAHVALQFVDRVVVVDETVEEHRAG